jgi:hypothetical protein
MEKSKEEILLDTMRCTITEEAEDINENYYFKWDDVLTVMEAYAAQEKKAYARQMVDKFFNSTYELLVNDIYEAARVHKNINELHQWLTDQGLTPRSQENNFKHEDGDEIIELLKEREKELYETSDFDRGIKEGYSRAIQIAYKIYKWREHFKTGEKMKPTYSA